KESLVTLVRVKRSCSREEAEAALATPPCTVASGLTHGEARELVEQVKREKATARILVQAGSGMDEEAEFRRDCGVPKLEESWGVGDERSPPHPPSRRYRSARRPLPPHGGGEVLWSPLA